jgi:branched-subunit amino acid transport protein
MLTILAMTALVFLSRYLFLEPSVPLRMNARAQRFLSYSAPAVLTAIWAPLVFAPEGELWLAPGNPYLLAGLAAVLLIWKTGNVLLTTVLSMGLFLLLRLI